MKLGFSMPAVTRALLGAMAVLALAAKSATPAWAHGLSAFVVASTAAGGGALAVDFDFRRVVPVSFVIEIGGSSLSTAGDIPFASLPGDDPGRGLYRLADGTAVTVEITALDPGAAMKLRGTVLDDVGDAILLGEQGAAAADDLDDEHPELQLVVPHPAGVYGAATIGFRLTTNAPGYAPSPTYVLRLSNGQLAPLGRKASAYDAATVACQATIGKAARAFASARQQALAKCLDKIAVAETQAYANLDATKARAAAAKICGDTLLAAVEKARAKAVAAMLKKCVDSGDLTPTSASTHVGLVACRVDEAVSASYPGAQGFLAEITVGGTPVDTRFPCLVPAPREP